MLVAVADHVWQSTLVVVVAGIVVISLRKHGAHLRYWIWLAASLKFLLPLSLLAALGAASPLRLLDGEREIPMWPTTAAAFVRPVATLSGEPLWPISRSTPAPRPTGPTDPARGRAATEETVAGPEVAEPGNRSASQLRENAAVTHTAAAPPLASAEPITTAASATSQAPADSSSRGLSWQQIAVGMWALGFAMIVASWARRWMKLRALARTAADAPAAVRAICAGFDVRITCSSAEPGTFGIVRPVLLLPESIVNRLTPAQLEAVVRHERSHIERHDNLTALPHMLVAAMFWFYPLVWWIGARLVAERERACDEAVVESGIERGTYARGIVTVGELCVDSPLPCAAGVGGGSLESRVRKILRSTRSRPLGGAGKAVLIAVPALVVATPLFVGALSTSLAHAQPGIAPPGNTTPESAAPEAARFETILRATQSFELRRELPLPPVEVPEAMLDRYVGYYRGVLETRAHDHSAVLAFRREGGNLVLDWHAGGSDQSFVLLPRSDSSFSALRRNERRVPGGKAAVTVYFTQDGYGLTANVTSSHSVPAIAARRIDDRTGRALVADIERRASDQVAAVGTRALVDEIVDRLRTGAVVGESLAARAARSLRERLDAWRPATLVGRGEPRWITLVQVLRDGTDVYRVQFSDVSLQIAVVVGLSTIDGVFLDAACYGQGELATGELKPCIAPFRVGATPVPSGQFRLRNFDEGEIGTELFRDIRGISPRGEWSHSLLLQGCYSTTPEADEAGALTLPQFERISDLVRYAFELERAELAWPDGTADAAIGVTIVGRDEPGMALRDADCRRLVRYRLAQEIGFDAHFETREVPSGWVLTALGPELLLDAASNREPATWFDEGSIMGRNATLAALASTIETQLRERVLDGTAIPGSYDFSFVWAAAPRDAADPRAHNLAAMVGVLERAGLTLVRTNRRVEQLVVDRVDLPLLPSEPPPKPIVDRFLGR